MKNFIVISGLSILLSQSSFPQSVPIPSPAEHCSVEKGNAEPRYPDSLRGSGVQGTVLIEAVIGKNGCAQDVRVVQKLHPELDKIAKQLVNSWKFQPALKGGKPVKVLVRIEVSFKDKS
jgi:protein TonB